VKKAAASAIKTKPTKAKTSSQSSSQHSTTTDDADKVQPKTTSKKAPTKPAQAAQKSNSPDKPILMGSVAGLLVVVGGVSWVAQRAQRQ